MPVRLNEAPVFPAICRMVLPLSSITMVEGVPLNELPLVSFFTCSGATGVGVPMPVFWECSKVKMQNAKGGGAFS